MEEKLISDSSLLPHTSLLWLHRPVVRVQYKFFCSLLQAHVKMCRQISHSFRGNL